MRVWEGMRAAIFVGGNRHAMHAVLHRCLRICGRR
jgi:hypothetical protein